MPTKVKVNAAFLWRDGITVYDHPQEIPPEPAVDIYTNSNLDKGVIDKEQRAALKDSGAVSHVFIHTIYKMFLQGVECFVYAEKEGTKDQEFSSQILRFKSLETLPEKP